MKWRILALVLIVGGIFYGVKYLHLFQEPEKGSIRAKCILPEKRNIIEVFLPEATFCQGSKCETLKGKPEEVTFYKTDKEGNIIEEKRYIYHIVYEAIGDVNVSVNGKLMWIVHCGDDGGWIKRPGEKRLELSGKCRIE